MQKTWSYKNYEIKEGLKPESSQFRYFFVVSESGEKKCNYCVWIVDDAMSRFDPSKDFNSIVASQIESWHNNCIFSHRFPKRQKNRLFF